MRLYTHIIRGFTLLELTVVLTVLSILTTASIPNIVEKYNENRARITLNEIQSINQAARLWAYRNAWKWPDGKNQCKGAFATLTNDQYIQGFDEVSPWNTKYETYCDPATATTPSPLFVVTTKLDPKWSGYIVNNLPTTETLENVKDTTLAYTTFSGAVPALKTVLHRNKIEGHPYLNQMNTTMDLNNNDILYAKDIEAIDVNASKEVKSKIVVAGNYVYTPKFIDANSGNENNPYLFDPNGVSVLDGQNGGIQSHNGATFALTVLNTSSDPNAQAGFPEGSLNVNDILFRSRPDFSDPNQPGWASDVGIRCFTQKTGTMWSLCGGASYLYNIKFKLFGKKYKIPFIPGEGNHQEAPYLCEAGTVNEGDPGRILEIASRRCRACGGLEDFGVNCGQIPPWWIILLPLLPLPWPFIL